VPDASPSQKPHMWSASVSELKHQQPSTPPSDPPPSDSPPSDPPTSDSPPSNPPTSDSPPSDPPPSDSPPSNPFKKHECTASTDGQPRRQLRTGTASWEAAETKRVSTPHTRTASAEAPRAARSTSSKAKNSTSLPPPEPKSIAPNLAIPATSPVKKRIPVDAEEAQSTEELEMAKIKWNDLEWKRKELAKTMDREREDRRLMHRHDNNKPEPFKPTTENRDIQKADEWHQNVHEELNSREQGLTPTPVPPTRFTRSHFAPHAKLEQVKWRTSSRLPPSLRRYQPLGMEENGKDYNDEPPDESPNEQKVQQEPVTSNHWPEHNIRPPQSKASCGTKNTTRPPQLPASCGTKLTTRPPQLPASCGTKLTTRPPQLPASCGTKLTTRPPQLPASCGTKRSTRPPQLPPTADPCTSPGRRSE
jgi:hypothetical protein